MARKIAKANTKKILFNKSSDIKQTQAHSVDSGKDKSKQKIVFRSDVKQTATLIKIGRDSAANAIKASKALGLSITYMQNGIIYKELPNGDKQIISSRSASHKKASIHLKKGLTLRVKK